MREGSEHDILSFCGLGFGGVFAVDFDVRGLGVGWGMMDKVLRAGRLFGSRIVYILRVSSWLRTCGFNLGGWVSGWLGWVIKVDFNDFCHFRFCGLVHQSLDLFSMVLVSGSLSLPRVLLFDIPTLLLFLRMELGVAKC